MLLIILLIIFNLKLNVAQNEINVQGELLSQTDNRTVSYEHRTGKILVRLK